MIRFRLKPLDELEAWGEGSDPILHWFGLTDGEFFWELEGERLFEYTPEAVADFKLGEQRLASYPLARLIEDLAETFAPLSESVPSEVWKWSQNIPEILTLGDDYQYFAEENGRDEEEVWEAYQGLSGWLFERAISFAHLSAGPWMYFIRYQDRIRIHWQAREEEFGKVWTADSGSTEIDYADFVLEMWEFGKQFFAKMEEQVNAALEKDWGAIRLDKSALQAEHAQRKSDFEAQLKDLNQPGPASTDWEEVLSMKSKMEDELREWGE